MSLRFVALLLATRLMDGVGAMAASAAPPGPSGSCANARPLCGIAEAQAGQTVLRLSGDAG